METGLNLLKLDRRWRMWYNKEKIETELDLPEPFFLLAYDAGLGSKNSQGFGMVEVVKS
jgi:CRISPR/Cas system endoribonuclease Cas6 (RAMP superfamily)